MSRAVTGIKELTENSKKNQALINIYLTPKTIQKANEKWLMIGF